MDKFLNSDISLVGAMEYVLLKVPFMFVQFTPASILLATIMVFGLMNRSNELLAIKSSGISVYFLLKPAILVGVILAALMFFLGETLIPVTMVRSNYIKYNVIKKNRNIYSARKDVWIKSENKLIHINFYDPVKQSAAGVTITSLRKNFSLESRIDAEKGFFKQGKWMFENIIEQIHSENSMDYDVKLYDEKSIPLSFKPEDLVAVLKKTEEMSFFELKKFVSKVEKEGYDAITYKVDLNGKIAFPFVCIIMILTGAATGIKSFAKENIPVAIAIGVVIAFMYWIMFGFCISIGYGGILPPFVSAWITNLVFGVISTLYLINTE
jgi:lipopolysaccharide export system permease protein